MGNPAEETTITRTLDSTWKWRRGQAASRERGRQHANAKVKALPILASGSRLPFSYTARKVELCRFIR